MLQEKENNQTLKEVSTPKYSISLVQARDGKYYIVYGAAYDGIVCTSEAVIDYNIASYLFDIKLTELEVRLN